MNKKTFIVLFILSITVAVVGVVLICYNSTPYLNCTYWLNSDQNNYELFSYALQNIGTYKLGYFGGIAVTVIGAMSTLVTIAVYAATRNPK